MEIILRDGGSGELASVLTAILGSAQVAGQLAELRSLVVSEGNTVAEDFTQLNADIQQQNDLLSQVSTGLDGLVAAQNQLVADWTDLKGQLGSGNQDAINNAAAALETSFGQFQQVQQRLADAKAAIDAADPVTPPPADGGTGDGTTPPADGSGDAGDGTAPTA